MLYCRQFSITQRCGSIVVQQKSYPWIKSDTIDKKQRVTYMYHLRTELPHEG